MTHTSIREALESTVPVDRPPTSHRLLGIDPGDPRLIVDEYMLVLSPNDTGGTSPRFSIFKNAELLVLGNYVYGPHELAHKLHPIILKGELPIKVGYYFVMNVHLLFELVERLNPVPNATV